MTDCSFLWIRWDQNELVFCFFVCFLRREKKKKKGKKKKKEAKATVTVDTLRPEWVNYTAVT